LAKKGDSRPAPPRRRAGPRLRAERVRGDEARFRALFEAATDAVFIETLDGRILDCNPTACEIYGYSRAEFLSSTSGTSSRPTSWPASSTSAKRSPPKAG